MPWRSSGRCPFARLTDDERWEYVKGLAKDVNFNAGLQQASDIYWSCKRTRDVVGHAPRLDLLYDPDVSLYRYVLDSRSKGVPEPLTPATLRLLATQCEWLQRLVEHLLFRGGGRSWGRAICMMTGVSTLRSLRSQNQGQSLFTPSGMHRLVALCPVKDQDAPGQLSNHTPVGRVEHTRWAPKGMRAAWPLARTSNGVCFSVLLE